MPKYAGPPLRKVTFNMEEADVEWFQRRHGQGYSAVMREVLHQHVQKASVVERTFEQNAEDYDQLFGVPDGRE